MLAQLALYQALQWKWSQSYPNHWYSVLKTP